jgi:hypothetical protein
MRSVTYQQTLSHSPLLPSKRFMGPPRSATVDQLSVSQSLSSYGREVDPGLPRRSPTYQPSLSDSRLAQFLPQMGPSRSQRSTMDRSQPPISPWVERTSSLAAGTWDGREGEELLIELHLVRYQSHDSRRQYPDILQQCRCRVFELLNDGYRAPTRRIVIQGCEDERQLVSYCKTKQIPIKSQVLSNRFILMITGQGCLSTMFMSRAQAAK